MYADALNRRPVFAKVKVWIEALGGVEGMPAQRNAKTIVDAVRDELGIDAYHLYEEERYSITAEILRAIATACSLEFIKGLTGFKGMGEQMREEAQELISRWRAREDLKEFARSERIDMITAEALAAIPPAVTHEKRQAARASLEAALIQFGLSGDDAKSHAHQIEDIVLGND